MTYQTFKKIAESFRKDVIVSQHGDYSNNKSKNTLGIIFIKPDGRQSKVYDYHGTYAEILNRLHIPVITKNSYNTTLAQLEYYKESHGTICPFFGDIIDYTEQIKEYEEKIKYYNSDKVVRDWEYK